MKITFLIDEDIVNYKKTSMFIGIPFCDGKCNKDYGKIICQNNRLDEYIEILPNKIVERYLNNPLTEAIVIGGREPLYKCFDEVLNLIKEFRKVTSDDIVIYTGYNKEEITNQINILEKYKNIIIKFGRFIPNKAPHTDKVLGITLTNPEQYAEKVG